MKHELKKWNPFAELGDFQGRMHQLLPGLWKGNGLSDNLLNGPDWEPAVDIEEDDKRYTITADLPDVKKEDLAVNIDDGVLSIAGERKHEEEKKGKTFHRIERFHGSYQRSFRLPDDVIEDKLDAHFKNGVLKITLPKELSKKKASTREIAIHS
jgi:HSP20 family protein